MSHLLRKKDAKRGEKGKRKKTIHLNKFYISELFYLRQLCSDSRGELLRNRAAGERQAKEKSLFSSLQGGCSVFSVRKELESEAARQAEGQGTHWRLREVSNCQRTLKQREVETQLYHTHPGTGVYSENRQICMLL